MRRILLFVGLLLFFSCSDDQLIEEKNMIVNDLQSRAGGDGLYDVMGFGYDITGDYAHPTSVKSRVIDVDRFVQENPAFYEASTTNTGSSAFTYGYSAEDYVKEIIKKTNGKINGGVGLKLFSGSLNFSYTYESEKKMSHSTKYSYANAEVCKNIKRLKLLETPQVLSNYLSPNFRTHLNTWSADDIVKQYGTHVLLDVTIGGRLYIRYKSSIIKTSNSTRKKQIVKAGLNVALKKISLGQDGDSSTEKYESLEKENQERTFYIEYIGGNRSGVNSYSLETGYPVVNISDWETSVNENNAGITSINWEVAYPIYDFVVDPVKKAEIKAAFTRYIESRRNEYLNIIPLYRYMSNKVVDHFYTTDWDLFREGADKYVFEGVACYVYADNVAGSIPLYRYWNRTLNDHFYTTNFAELGNGGNSGYVLEGVACYTPKADVQCAVPLYCYMNNKYSDHFYTTNRNENPVNLVGYQLEGIRAYVFE